jgi:hypothetical protein
MEHCKGCAVNKCCTHMDYSEECPCTICLVKVTCAYDLCDEYRNFQSAIRSIQKETRK